MNKGARQAGDTRGTRRCPATGRPTINLAIIVQTARAAAVPPDRKPRAPESHTRPAGHLAELEEGRRKHAARGHTYMLFLSSSRVLGAAASPVHGQHTPSCISLAGQWPCQAARALGRTSAAGGLHTSANWPEAPRGGRGSAAVARPRSSAAKGEEVQLRPKQHRPYTVKPALHVGHCRSIWGLKGEGLEPRPQRSKCLPGLHVACPSLPLPPCSVGLGM